MKIGRLRYLILAFLFSQSAQAQINPEMLVQIHNIATTAEMNTITPSIGALIFNTENKKIFVHDGTNWVSLSLPTATPGSVSFAGTNGNPSEDNNQFFFDNTNNRLGIGTNSPVETVDIIGSISVTGGFKDSNGEFGVAGEVLQSTATGTDWAPSYFMPVPHLDKPQVLGINQTKTLTFTGSNFVPSSTMSFPSFPGTINSVTVVSPTAIEVNITADNTVADYSVVVSNNGQLNSQWPNNEVNKLLVYTADGTEQYSAGLTCKEILDDGYSTGDGVYWINPIGNGTEHAFQAYCDMTTDGGGWTRLSYTQDLTHQDYFPNTGDSWRWIPNNFSLNLSNLQIDAIRSHSSEGKQTYQGTCDGVIHYEYANGNYSYSLGFRFQNGDETNYGAATYSGTNITVSQDGCKTNNNTSTDTVFDIYDVRVPIINVNTRDNGDNNELFGSPLTNNPAWLR